MESEQRHQLSNEQQDRLLSTASYDMASLSPFDAASASSASGVPPSPLSRPTARETTTSLYTLDGVRCDKAGPIEDQDAFGIATTNAAREINADGRAYVHVGDNHYHGPVSSPSPSPSPSQNNRGPDIIHARREAPWIVPFGRNANFVGRERILDDLLERILPTTHRGYCQRTAIEGLGGVGKTQIALEAAFRVRDADPDCAVFWVPAVDTSSFENACREICRELKVQDSEQDIADVKAQFKSALEHQDAKSWLLVVDNADDTELLFGNPETPQASPPLNQYLPVRQNGSILFTSRNRAAAVRLAEQNIVDVPLMALSESLNLFKESLVDSSMTCDEETITELLDLLEHLPLAIRQASAYINETQISPSKYLEIFKSDEDSMIHLLSKEFQDNSQYNETKDPVATTWVISFRQIQRRSKLAADYLRFISFLAQQDIPQALLPPDEKANMAEAIGVLKGYGFITERGQSGSYDMHRLVRLAMQYWLAQKKKTTECVTTVIRHLSEVFPDPSYENRVVWTGYLPHALMALGFRQYSADETATLDLLCSVANCYYQLGHFRQAEPIYREILAATKKSRYLKLWKWTRDEVSLIRTRAKEYLSHLLLGRGKYEEAEKLYRELLKSLIRKQGPDHLDVLFMQTNVAHALYNQEKYDEAETLYEKILATDMRVLGAEHPKTLRSQINLANSLYSQDKYAEAEATYNKLLPVQLQLEGQNHPNTLILQCNLARVMHKQGKNKPAEELLRTAAEAQACLLGCGHPNTLRSQIHLGDTLLSQCRYQEAESMYREILKQGEEGLGSDHPLMRESQGRLRQTLKFMERGYQMSDSGA